MKRKPKLSRTQVTFDKSARLDVWQLVLSKVKNTRCPFCAKEVTEKTFGGAAFIDGGLRVFHNDIVCVLAFEELETDSD